MLQSTVFREIDNLARHINNIYESIFKKYGLHRGQFVFISRIVENKSINLKELAKTIRVDKTTVTKAIQKLEDSGYINKKVDQTDNRIIHLIATELGVSLYQNIIADKNALLGDIMDKFSIEEITEYIAMTRKLNNQLDSFNKGSQL